MPRGRLKKKKETAKTKPGRERKKVDEDEPQVKSKSPNISKNGRVKSGRQGESSLKKTSVSKGKVVNDSENNIENDVQLETASKSYQKKTIETRSKLRPNHVDESENEMSDEQKSYPKKKTKKTHSNLGSSFEHKSENELIDNQISYPKKRTIETRSKLRPGDGDSKNEMGDKPMSACKKRTKESKSTSSNVKWEISRKLSNDLSETAQLMVLNESELKDNFSENDPTKDLIQNEPTNNFREIEPTKDLSEIDLTKVFNETVSEIVIDSSDSEEDKTPKKKLNVSQIEKNDNTDKEIKPIGPKSQKQESRKNDMISESDNDSTEYEWKLVPKKKINTDKGKNKQPMKYAMKVFRCEFCDESFDDSGSHQNHVSLHLPFGKRPFRCVECGRTFAEKCELTKHERVHNIQRPYHCHICDKRFAARKSLKGHMSDHTGKKPYKCLVCERAFFYSATLKSHMVTHETEKKYKCKLCDKQYIRKQGFEHHMMVHEGIKPFRCDVCNDDFRSKFDLESHMLYHTGEHPFKCDDCGKAFMRASVLKTHKLVHLKQNRAVNKIKFDATMNILDKFVESTVADMSVEVDKISPQKEPVPLRITNENRLSEEITHDLPCEDSQREIIHSEGQINQNVSKQQIIPSGEVIPALPGEITLVEASRDEIDHIIVKTEVVNDFTSIQVQNNVPNNQLTNTIKLMTDEIQKGTGEVDECDNASDISETEGNEDIDILLSSLGTTKSPQKVSKSCLIPLPTPKDDNDPAAAKMTCSVPQTTYSNSTIPEKSKSESCEVIDIEDMKELFAKVPRKKGFSKVRNNIREHVCPVCDKRFIYPVHLKYHMITHSDERPHKCTVCGVGFKHKVNLRQHAKTHQTDKPFKCKICGADFRIKQSLKGHVKAVHLKIRPFKCDICDKTFTRRINLTHHVMFIHEKKSRPPTGFKAHMEKGKCTTCGKVIQKKNLAEHMSTHSEIPSFTCKVCGKGFYWRRSYTRHLLTHNSEKPYKCDKCDKSYAEQSGLNVHFKSVHCEKTAVCQTCGKAFVTEHRLLCHQKIHNPDFKLPFACSFCEKSFHYECGLKSHMITHTGERNHQCPVCGKCFTRDSVLRIHMRTHFQSLAGKPSTRKKTDQCPLCNRWFNSKNHLKEHMRTHTGERPFSCSICGKSYATRKAVKYHMANHTGHKPFSCDICGKAFASNAANQVHKRVHSQPTNSCDICGKMFKSLDGLKGHMVSAHTENPPRPFICEICGKDFPTNGGLTKHTLFHTNERKFECDICGKRYYLNQHLQGHMRSHTGEKPYGCRYCEKVFQTRHGWKKHMMRIHQSYDVSKESPHMSKNMIPITEIPIDMKSNGEVHVSLDQSESDILVPAAEIRTASEEITIDTSNIITTEIHPGSDSDTVYILTY